MLAHGKRQLVTVSLENLTWEEGVSCQALLAWQWSSGEHSLQVRIAGLLVLTGSRLNCSLGRSGQWNHAYSGNAAEMCTVHQQASRTRVSVVSLPPQRFVWYRRMMHAAFSSSRCAFPGTHMTAAA